MRTGRQDWALGFLPREPGVEVMGKTQQEGPRGRKKAVGVPGLPLASAALLQR